MGAVSDIPIPNADINEDAVDRPASAGSRKNLFQYLSRDNSSQSLSSMPDRNLVRKNSVSSFVRHRPKLALNCHSLDQMYRMGGASVLSLPEKYTAGDLTVPTCIAGEF